ncbi:MAG: hypothetical protein AAF608_04470 [Pseudomonadota bacterium]
MIFSSSLTITRRKLIATSLMVPIALSLPSARGNPILIKGGLYLVGAAAVYVGVRRVARLGVRYCREDYACRVVGQSIQSVLRRQDVDATLNFAAFASMPFPIGRAIAGTLVAIRDEIVEVDFSSGPLVGRLILENSSDEQIPLSETNISVRALLPGSLFENRKARDTVDVLEYISPGPLISLEPRGRWEMEFELGNPAFAGAKVFSLSGGVGQYQLPIVLR